MSKLKLLILAALLFPAQGFAQEHGSVVKALRPELRTFDDKGQPLGQIKASELKLPTPIVGYGVGNSIGVRQGANVVYLRGLDVQTNAAKAACAPVQQAARAKGSAYAASNMGLGGAADCKPAN